MMFWRSCGWSEITAQSIQEAKELEPWPDVCFADLLATWLEPACWIWFFLDGNEAAGIVKEAILLANQGSIPVSYVIFQKCEAGLNGGRRGSIMHKFMIFLDVNGCENHHQNRQNKNSHIICLYQSIQILI